MKSDPVGFIEGEEMGEMKNVGEIKINKQVFTLIRKDITKPFCWPWDAFSDCL